MRCWLLLVCLATGSLSAAELPEAQATQPLTTTANTATVTTPTVTMPTAIPATATPEPVQPASANLTVQVTATGLYLTVIAPLTDWLEQRALDRSSAAHLLHLLNTPALLWKLPAAAKCTVSPAIIQQGRVAELLRYQSSLSQQQENKTRVAISLPKQSSSQQLSAIQSVATGELDDQVQAEALQVSYRYTCENPDKLRQVGVQLMQVFPAMQSVQVELMTSSLHKQLVLKASQPLLKW